MAFAVNDDAGLGGDSDDFRKNAESVINLVFHRSVEKRSRRPLEDL